MENTRILKMRLGDAAVGVEQAAKSLSAVFQIVEESRSYAKPDGKGLRRYLVALVKWDDWVQVAWRAVRRLGRPLGWRRTAARSTSD